MLLKIASALATLAMLYAGYSNAHAMQLDSGDNKHIYLSADGTQINAIEAFKQAMADKAVLDCTPVEAVGNQRTGKVTLKKKK